MVRTGGLLALLCQQLLQGLHLQAQALVFFFQGGDARLQGLGVGGCVGWRIIVLGWVQGLAGFFLADLKMLSLRREWPSS